MQKLQADELRENLIVKGRNGDFHHVTTEVSIQEDGKARVGIFSRRRGDCDEPPVYFIGPQDMLLAYFNAITTMLRDE
jgi:hypothetical protein